MGKASRRKQNKRKLSKISKLEREIQPKYSKSQIEIIYKGLIKQWLNFGNREVAIMKDESEIFLDQQEILTRKGWFPLNENNIDFHKNLIEENLAGKHKDTDLLTLLEEAGYTIIMKE